MAIIAVVCGLPRSLELFRADLLKALQREGHTVVALGPDIDPATERFLKSLGITYRRIDLARASLSPFGDLRTWRSLHTAFKQLRPDCIIAYTIKPVVYGMLAAATAGVRRRYAMITGLGYAFTEGADGDIKRRLVRCVARALYSVSLRLATGVIFQNRDDHALFRDMRVLPQNKATITVPGSGIDLALFPQQPVPHETRLLMIARLVADKGVREYLEAAKMVARDCPHVTFDLVGPLDPNPTAVSEAEIKQAAAEGYVHYHGETQDVRPFLTAASIYVLPSYREGMPRSVLEAMATGRAIITSDVAGCRETVEPERNGLLVPARNAGALADAMRRLIGDRGSTVAMGQASRELVEARFAASSITTAMLNFCGLTRQAVPAGSERP